MPPPAQAAALRGVNPAAPARPPSVRRGPGIVAWAMLAAFALTLVSGTFRNDFPSAYHPDEPSKVAQVLTGERNYYHPPLMLALAGGALRAAGIAPQAQNVARTGRFLSALYLAAAAALLTWLAGRYGGPGGAVCAAAALGTDAQAAMAGHFFKEDALFALTLALTFCAGAVHWRRRGAASLLALGAAAGLALSSKYVGALAVVYALALAALATAGRGDAWTRLTRRGAVWVCAGTTATVFLLLNGNGLLRHSRAWWQGLAYSAAVSTGGNHDVGARVPHLQFVGMFLLLTPLPVLAGAGLFWAGLRRCPFRAHADRWLAGLAPGWMLAVFSFSASTAVRYFLPVSLVLDAVAGAALPGAMRWALARWRRGRPLPGWVPTLAAALLVAACNVPRLWSLLDGFAGDDRAALRGWVAVHLPPSAVIAQDALAQLPGGAPALSRRSVADLGDVAALRARGVTHVLVCWYDSRRFVDGGKRPAPGTAADYERRRAFYRDLPVRARSLWRSELRQPYVLRPGLELFALDDGQPPPPPDK